MKSKDELTKWKDIAAALWQHMIRFDAVCKDQRAIRAMRKYERASFGKTLDNRVQRGRCPRCTHVKGYTVPHKICGLR